MARNYINRASDGRRSVWRNSNLNPTLTFLDLHRLGDRLNDRDYKYAQTNVIKFPETYRYAIGAKVQYRRSRHVDMRLHTGYVLSRDVDFDGVTALYTVSSDLGGKHVITHQNVVDSLSIVRVA